MKTLKVQVTVSNAGITVDTDPVIMTRKDSLQWVGNRGFSIEFEGTGPFTKPRLAHAEAVAARNPASAGRFKYTVISDDDPKVKLDPVIIVEEPKTDPTP